MAERSARSSVGREMARALRQHQSVERLGRVGHWYLPAGRPTIRWSREAARIHGCSGAPSRVDLPTLLHVYGPEDRNRLLAGLDGAVASGERFDFEATLLSGPEARHVRLVGEAERGPDGSTLGVLVVVHDITEHRAALSELAIADARKADFAEMASDWNWETGPDHRLTYVSPQCERVTGIPAEAQLGRTRLELLAGDQIPAEMEKHLHDLERHVPFRDFRYWRRGPDGKRRFMSTSGKPIFDQSGRFLGYRGLGRDLTAEETARQELIEANRRLRCEKRRAEEALNELQRANAMLAEHNAAMARAEAELRHAALHDSLTGLPNRRHLDEKLWDCAHACRRRGDWLGVLHLGLYRFRQTNETLGHATGDLVLREVGRLLSAGLAPGEFVARVGGDEFVIVCPGRDVLALEGLAEKLLAAFERPISHGRNECWIGARIGIAAMPGEQVDPAELLINADIALHRTRNRGRGAHRVFSAELQREVVRQKSLADSMLVGMKRAEFVPFYQPQICAKTYTIVGVEALARWMHPAEGLLAPGAFLGVAEDLGVVARLDQTILELAVDDLNRWRTDGLIVPKLSVNVSARRLLDREMIESVRAIAPPEGGLSFELLESTFLDELEDTIAWNIDMLKEMGVEVELDDFGSGHASILSLVKLGPAAIKIDRELVWAATADRTRCGLVRSIVDIGRSLRTRVIAEGVETEAQAGLLRELGCDALQGYYFAAPMSARDFVAFARSWEGERRVAALAG